MFAIYDVKDGDLFTEFYDSFNEAVDQADYEWNIMSKHDKELRSEYKIVKFISDWTAGDHGSMNIVDMKIYKA